MIKVSIVYSKTGGGHLSLAYATQEALEKYYPRRFQINLVDPFPPFYSIAYRKLGAEWQKLWQASFKATDNQTLTRLAQQFNNLPSTNSLSLHFAEFKPDIVIINNPLSTLNLNRALEKSGIPAKSVIHFADPFKLHQTWFICQNIDLYLSPTAEATAIAIENGIPPQQVKTIGWLSRQKFVSGPISQKKARENLGLPKDKFIVFVGGAGQGGGQLFEFIDAFVDNEQIQKKVFFIVNTGLNVPLLSKITRLVEKNPQSFYIIPYAHNMPQLLWASDIVLGKAGPNFIFEAIHSLRPILANGCLPGQEEGNLDFIQRENIGWVEKDPYKAIELIDSFVKNPKKLQPKIQSLKKIKKVHSDSGKKIANEIYRLSKTIK